MRAVVQRVREASVRVEEKIVGKIEKGFLVYLAIEEADASEDLSYMLKKVSGLRVFSDDEGKMNLSIKEVQGSVLVVSQFTLYGDVRKGYRPSFTKSAHLEKAKSYYEMFCKELRALDIQVEEGQFQSDMKVSSINDGPVTLLLDSSKLF